MQQRRGPDTLDKTVTYLAKRDGIDKASEISHPLPVHGLLVGCLTMDNETHVLRHTGTEGYQILNKACVSNYSKK